MKQEEEKLIEELNEEIWWDSDLSEGENWKKYIIPLILKVYRSGKLAGFEFVEREVVKPILASLDEIPAYKKAIKKTRQFIEEEKKKL